MEREVSLAMEIGVSLFVLAIVINLIWFTVIMGKDFANSKIETANDIVNTVEVGELSELSEVEREMPTASVYNIIRTYGPYIVELYCDKCDKTTYISAGETPCILEHLHGKPIVKVVKTEYGWYNMELSYLENQGG